MLIFRLKLFSINVNSSDQFKEVGFRGDYRYDILIGPECEEIANFATKCFWIPVIEQFFAKWTVDVSIIYTRGGAANQRWHADGGHLKREFGDDGPYGICVFLPLIDLDYEVGFTQFWPGSHRSETFCDGNLAEQSLHLNCQLDAVVKQGNCIFYDYRLMHRGMENVSNDLRPIVQFFYHDPAYIEKKNYGVKSIFDDHF
jgi:ectoine hydroxylase-related dioxygenase (phytanoyl-CoA dioxygenase family)